MTFVLLTYSFFLYLQSSLTWVFQQFIKILGWNGDKLLICEANVVIVRDKLTEVPVLIWCRLTIHATKNQVSLFSLSAAVCRYCSVWEDCSLICSVSALHSAVCSLLRRTKNATRNVGGICLLNTRKILIFN